MFKKILPAIMLLTVVTLSFAFRPAPAKHKLATDTIFVFNNGAWAPGDLGEEALCGGDEEFCAITYDSGVISEANAKAKVDLAHPENYSNAEDLGESVTVYLRNEETK